MTKLTTTDRDWKSMRAEARKRVPVRNGFGYHFNDHIVVRINQFQDGAPLRTVVLPTGGVDSKPADIARARRMFRRLKNWAGVRLNTQLDMGRECDGVFGTVFAHTISAAAVPA